MLQKDVSTVCLPQNRTSCLSLFLQEMETQRILFYSAQDPYGEFSNFYSAPINLNDQTWPTTEHYFQAMKFEGSPYKETIRTANKPGKAASLGRSRAHPIRPDWEQVKYGIMKEAVRAKFQQHQHLKELLLGTGQAELVEHTSRDRCWADGGDGTGLNWLGKVLMEVREELRSQQT